MPLSIHFSQDTVRLGRTMNHRISSLNVTFRRISTGLRVTQAADDAAGLAISNRLKSQLKAAQKEVEGTTQKMSLLQTLDAALAKSEERLIKMRELATQASNGTVSFKDRQTLNSELNDIMDELRDISDTAVFNGIKLLDADEPLMVSITNDETPKQLLTATSVRPEKLARQSSAASMRRGLFLDPLSSNSVSVNGVSIRATTDADDELSYSYKAGSALAKAKAINHSTQFTGVTAWVGENVITGIEPVRELDLTNEHWLKINGWAVSGFKLEEKDSSEMLLKHINAGLAESGVVATKDKDGYLTLSAADGRNITIEYSDAYVRNALRVIDVYGDPTNLGNSVDPPVYSHQGDILSVEFDTQGSYSDTATVHGSYEVDGVVTNDQTGRHLGKTDYADYRIEIVKPGAVGQATYRIKKEELAVGTIDSEPESGRFNQRGTVTSDNTSRIVEHSSSYYNSASDRQYRIVVREAGDPTTNRTGFRPLVEIFETNLSDGINQEISLGNRRLEADDTIDVGNGLILQIKDEDGYYIETNGQKTYGNASNYYPNVPAELVIDPPGHDYSSGPIIWHWNGGHTTTYEFEIESAGHAFGTRAYGFVDEPKAVLTISAEEELTGKQIDPRQFTLTNTDGYFRYNGLSFSFPWIHSYGQVSDYQKAAYSEHHFRTSYAFVNETPREYVLTATEASVMTHDEPAEFRLDVYDIDQTTGLKTLIQSTNEEVYSYGWVNLGLKKENGVDDFTEADGGFLQLGVYTVKLDSQREVNSGDGSITFSSNDYITPEDHVAVMEITHGGDLGSSAQFKYYYKDNPSHIVDSGVLQNTAVLSDGVQYTATNSTAAGSATMSETNGVAFSGGLVSSRYTGEQRGNFTLDVNHDNTQGASLSQSAGSAAHFELKSDQYAGYFDGNYTITFRDNTSTPAHDDYLMDVDFSFSNGSSSSTTLNFTEDTDIDIGYGLTVHFKSPLAGDSETSITESAIGLATLSEKNSVPFSGGLVSDHYSGNQGGSYTLNVSHDNSQSASLTQSNGSSAYFALKNDQYTGYFDGNYTITFRENTGTAANDDYLMDINFNFSDGSSSNSTLNFVEDSDIDIGHGLTVHFKSPQLGDSEIAIDENVAFSGTATATDYFGTVNWSYNDGSSSGPTTVDLGVDQTTQLGNNVSIQVTNLAQGMEFEGTVNPNVEFAGTVTATDYFGTLNWTYENGTSSGPTPVDLGVNQTTQLGDNISFKVTNLAKDMQFQGTVNPRNFDIGDQWEATILARAYQPNDYYVVRYEPVDLEKFARWKITAHNPGEWLKDDEIIINATHNYEDTEQTLTNMIDYSPSETSGMGTVELTGSGQFQTGDLIKVKTRAFMGEIETYPGNYTFGHYPTTYNFTVVKGGPIDQAEIAWVREDQRTDTENNGSGFIGRDTPLVVDEYIYIEEGIRVKIKDVVDSLGNSIAHLAQGDEFSVVVGEKLEYTFAGQITLKSEDNIDLQYNSSAQDNLLGRINFLGTEVEANEEGGEEYSLQQGLLGKSLDYSLATTNLLSSSGIREALHSIDLSLKQVGENRSRVGAAMNQVERHALNLSQKSIDLMGIQMRLQNSDIAHEVAGQAAAQIQLGFAPALLESSQKNALMILNLVDQKM